MGCQDFTWQVQQVWDFIFVKYGFKILFCKDGEHDSCALFAESSSCRARFTRVGVDNDLDIAFGSRNAPLDWSREEKNPLAKQEQWFDLGGLLNYLEYNPEKPHTSNAQPISEPNKRQENSMSLANLARRAEAYMPQILASFENEDAYYRFRLGYGNYRTWGGRF